MTFTDLRGGASVLLDANTLLYHFTANPKHGDACTDLVERVERQELIGLSSTNVISEVAHRLGPKAGQVRYWQYGQAEKSPDLAISDLSRFLALDSKPR